MTTRSNNRHAKPAHKEHKYSMGVCCRIKLLVIISLPKFHSCNFPKHVSQIHTVQVPPTLETYSIQGNIPKLGICRINSYSNISSHKNHRPYMLRYQSVYASIPQFCRKPHHGEYTRIAHEHNHHENIYLSMKYARYHHNHESRTCSMRMMSKTKMKFYTRYNSHFYQTNIT